MENRSVKRHNGGAAQTHHRLSSPGNKDMSGLIFTLPTQPSPAHCLCGSHTRVSIFVRTFVEHRAAPHLQATLSEPGRPRLNPRTNTLLSCLGAACMVWMLDRCVCACVFLRVCGQSGHLWACVYPGCTAASEQHLFRGCCSSWLLFNWISSSRASSCQLRPPPLAITSADIK